LSNSTLSRVKSASTSSVCLVPSSFIKLSNFHISKLSNPLGQVKKSSSHRSFHIVFPTPYFFLYFLLSLSLHSSAFQLIPTLSHTQFSHTHYVWFYQLLGDLHVFLASDDLWDENPWYKVPLYLFHKALAENF
jgi:hypothetical protein